MTRCFIAFVAVILLLIWPSGTQAHVPVAGEVGPVTTVCYPTAQDALLNVVRAQGAKNKPGLL